MCQIYRDLITGFFCFTLLLPVSHAENDEILVNARKRLESPQETPVTVTQFDDEALSEPINNTTADLAKQAPNVDFINTAPFSGSSNAASIYIRGIGQNDFLLTTDPAISLYLDGVYIARSIGGILGLNDIDSVEILSGPQGTLFGKNSIGGAIQISSKKPSADTRGHVSTTLGSRNRQDLSAHIEGSLSANIQARLNISREHRDGYVERVNGGSHLGDINRQTIKATVNWDISDSTQLLATIDHTRQRQEAIAQTLVAVTSTPRSTAYNNEAPVAFDDRWITDSDFKNNQTGPSQDDLDSSGLSMTITHQFNTLELTSVTGYRTMDAIYARDPDGSPLQYAHSINTDDHKQFSQELRLQGNLLNDQIDWLIGAYYFEESGSNLTEGFLFSNTAVAFDFTVDNAINTRSLALFTHNIWRATDKLSFTGGIRATREDKTFSVISQLTNGFIIADTSANDDWTNVSPMIGMDYRFTDRLFGYVTASRGFKSGGYNGRQIFPGDADKFEPEFATSIEAGLKTSLMDKTVDITASVFTTRYEDMQFTVLFGGIIPQIANAAEARINGAETIIEYQSESPFRIKAGIGYLDAQYTHLDDDTFLDDDLALIRTPKWNAFIKPSYLWFTDSGDWQLSGLLRYKSRVYNDALNSSDIAQGGFTTLDLSGTWYDINERWTASAFVTNVTDKRYIISGSTDKTAFGGSEVNIARPREYGLKLEYRF